jgi:hypothetical protein
MTHLGEQHLGVGLDNERKEVPSRTTSRIPKFVSDEYTPTNDFRMLANGHDGWHAHSYLLHLHLHHGTRTHAGV